MHKNEYVAIYRLVGDRSCFEHLLVLSGGPF